MPAFVVSSGIDLSDEVVQFAKLRGVSDQLPRVLEMTRSLFPEARYEVEIYEDHDLPDDVFLAIVVRHDIDDAADLASRSTKWCQQIFDCCPPPLGGVFLLDTDWRP